MNKTSCNAKLYSAICTALLLVACGAKSPTAPAVVTGTVGARIDSDCSGFKFGVTSVTVSVDGIAAGTTAPGGAVTKVVPVGTHSVTGRAQNGLVWAGDVVVTTAANPDGIKFFACL